MEISLVGLRARGIGEIADALRESGERSGHRARLGSARLWCRGASAGGS
jgi:hypothetical protein